MNKDKKYNFQNPEVQAKAVALAKESQRPTSYNTPKKMALEMKKELIKEEILKSGFLNQIQSELQEITQVMIDNAKTPEGVADRRLLMRATGMLHTKTVAELEWEAGAQQRARTLSIKEQLSRMGRTSLG